MEYYVTTYVRIIYKHIYNIDESRNKPERKQIQKKNICNHRKLVLWDAVVENLPHIHEFLGSTPSSLTLQNM